MERQRTLVGIFAKSCASAACTPLSLWHPICTVLDPVFSTGTDGVAMKDLLVRVVLVVAIAVAAMAWLGWLSFSRTDDRATIEVNTQKIEQAADHAAQAGRNLAEEANETIHEATAPERVNTEQ